MLLTLFLIFLVPVTIYCLVLGNFNRRWNPIMVSGVWDCLGLLFAVSGFFLVVVPTMLHLVYLKTARELPFDDDGNGFEDLWLGWWGIWLIYYALLTAGAGLMLWFRRRKTVIYNVDPDAFDKVFGVILTRLGLEKTRSGAHLVIGPVSGTDTTQLLPEEGIPEEGIVEGNPAPAVQPQAPADAPPVLVRIDPFPSLAHVTLHWEVAHTQLRRDIEVELAGALKHVQTPDNPAGSWILGIGGILLGFVFLIVLVIVMIAYFPPRRW